jgi:glycosyltransferase involved in cell wall biosynthesis
MAAKKRVLILLSGLAIGDRLGGAERFAIELARHLDPDRFEPQICALWRFGGPAETHYTSSLIEAGIPVFLATDYAGKLNPLAFIRSVRNILDHYRDASIDVIHSVLPLAGLAAFAIRRPLHARAIVRTAFSGHEWGDGAAAFLCRQIFTNWVFPLAFDAEACVSQHMVDRFNRRPGARLAGKRALFLPNAIDLKRFDAGTTAPGSPEHPAQGKRAEFGLSSDDFIIGCVGRLSAEKGHSVLLDAAAIVTAQAPDVKLLIIGDGPLRNALNEQAGRLGLGSKLILAGPRTDVDVLYRMMDLFVLPSLWEGLPTVILESMASGVPVVATDIPGSQELVQPGLTGWLARPADPASLAAQILAARRDHSGRAAAAERARREVVPRFAIEQVVEKCSALYTRVLT